MYQHDMQKGLLGLQFLLPQELTKIPGVGKVKAIQLLALAEISKRMNLEQLQKKLEFHTPDTIGASAESSMDAPDTNAPAAMMT